MNESANNNTAYSAPEAALVSTEPNIDILQLKRFSTWAVLALNMITQGIYGAYWLSSRTNQLNKILDNKISTTPSMVYLVTVIAMLFLNMIAEENLDGAVLILFLVVFISFIVSYVMTVFKMKAALEEIMPSKSLGGAMTFLFSSVYFQYKINEEIDESS